MARQGGLRELAPPYHAAGGIAADQLQAARGGAEWLFLPLPASRQMVIPSPRYQTRAFPRSRRLVIDSSAWGRRHHTIHILAEFDVTEARRIVHEHAAATGEKLSFTAYVAACIGRAVATDRNWHAYRKGRKLILFDDVDIGILIDHEVEHERLATIYVVRSAQVKTVREIHDEIRAAQRQRIEDVAGVDRWLFFLSLPGFLRRLFYWWLDRSPETRKRAAGTVLLTAPGMFGKGGGWGIPTTINTLTVTTGGVATKPGVVNGEIVPREFMDMTISFDHDVVDGGPAARFASCLREIVEGAALLAEFAPLSSHQGATSSDGEQRPRKLG